MAGDRIWQRRRSGSLSGSPISDIWQADGDVRSLRDPEIPNLPLEDPSAIADYVAGTIDEPVELEEETEGAACLIFPDAAAAPPSDVITPSFEDEGELELAESDAWTPQLFDPWSTVDAVAPVLGGELDEEEVTEDWAPFPILDVPLLTDAIFGSSSEDAGEEEATEDWSPGIFDAAPVALDFVVSVIDEPIEDEAATEDWSPSIFDAAPAAALDFIVATVDEPIDDEATTEDALATWTDPAGPQPDWQGLVFDEELADEEPTEDAIGAWTPPAAAPLTDYVAFTSLDDALEEEATEDASINGPFEAAAVIIVVGPAPPVSVIFRGGPPRLGLFAPDPAAERLGESVDAAAAARLGSADTEGAAARIGTAAPAPEAPRLGLPAPDPAAPNIGGDKD